MYFYLLMNKDFIIIIIIKSLSYYKCFFEPFSSAEAQSLGWAVGRGKPLNENIGERWFSAD